MKADEELRNLVLLIARSNSRKAYEEIFELLFFPVRNFAFSIVRSYELAEEIASDVLLMIWEQRNDLVRVSNVRYYAFVAAKNKAFNILKKAKGLTHISLNDIDFDIELEDPSPEDVFYNDEMVELLNKAISELPKQCKLVFKLVREEGFSYQEVAEMLDVSPKTVDSHLVNATKRLAKVLKREFKLR